MMKRFLLALACIAAFTVVGFSLTNEAHAWRGGYYGRPYRAYYGPPAVYYAPRAVPYRAYYAPQVVAPVVYPAPVYYAPTYPAYPVYSPGVSVSVGY